MSKGEFQKTFMSLLVALFAACYEIKITSALPPTTICLLERISLIVKGEGGEGKEIHF